MAVRLPVILSQPVRRDASTTDLVENIVAAALLVPGLDANLIGDISAIESGSTDHVCLLGHTRDLVLASFLELSEAQAAWQRLGQSGHFVDLSQDETGIRASLRGVAGGRKVFYYQLAIGQPPERLLEPCRQLLAAQRLSLVSIQGLSGGSSLPMAAAQAAGAPDQASSSLPSSSLPLARASDHRGPAGRPQPLPQIEPARGSQFLSAAGRQPDQAEEWSALDKLVDDLDAMDL